MRLFEHKKTFPFAHYFEDHYETKCPFQDWSAYNKASGEKTITNNVAKSQNSLLLQFIGKKQGLQYFENKIKNLEQNYYMRYKSQTFTEPEISRIHKEEFNQKNIKTLKKSFIRLFSNCL